MEPNVFISLDINNEAYDITTLIFEKLCKYENGNAKNKIIKNFNFLRSKMIRGLTFNTELGIMLQRKNKLRLMINFNSLESLSDFLKEIKVDYSGVSQLIDILKLLTRKEIGSLGLTLDPLEILDTIVVEVYPRDWNIMLALLEKKTYVKIII